MYQQSTTALLFDLDGTLLDSIDLLIECMQHAFEDNPRKPLRAEWIAGIGTPLRTQLAQWADDDAMIESLVQKYRDYQDLHLEKRTSLYPGIRDLLLWAHERGHPMAIVTSKGRGMTSRSLAHLEIAELFDAVITVESTARHKPHPEPVMQALTQLGNNAGAAMFVGDSPHDMRAGAAAGVQTVACTWGPYSREQLAATNPTWWANSVADLQGVIRNASEVPQ